MKIIEIFARNEKNLRKYYRYLPPIAASFIYSNGRKAFLNFLVHGNYDLENRVAYSDQQPKIKLWDIDFNTALFNSAGMFKYGYGYELCVYQGAGAFLAGTTTALPRSGNKKNGILHPFCAFPMSDLAINWMGLPNEGHEIVASRLYKINKIKGVPIGASVASSPEQHGLDALKSLVKGMQYYSDANVDFIELNESCPNVEHDSCSATIDGIDKNLIERLEYISLEFLKKRKRNLPVIVKFSVDTDLNNIHGLIKILTDLKFDGVNIGNTSTNYDLASKFIHSDDKNNFDYFRSEFGGGVSGVALKQLSLNACAKANEVLSAMNLTDEFHVIRTGGIFSKNDIDQSREKGILMNQWFTGYFDAFADFGHNLYKRILI